MDFNKEFGHWWVDHDRVTIHHRLKIHSYRTLSYRTLNPPICGFTPDVWLSRDQVIIYKNICKTCLNTYTEEEIRDLKQYLIIKKLKGQ